MDCWTARFHAGLSLCAAVLFLSLPPPSRAQEKGFVLTVDLNYPQSESFPLSDVWQILPGPDGTIYVVDRLIRGVGVFDPDGQHVRTLGRSGSGPGEFRTAPYVGWIRDTLWALDMSLRRVTLFDSAGNPVDTRPVTQFTQVDPYSIPRPRYLLQDGTVLVTETPSASSLSEFEDRGELLQRSSLDGEMVDTLCRVSTRNRLLRITSPDGEATLQTFQPWSDSDLWTVSPVGKSIVVIQRPAPQGKEGTYHVTRLSLAGRVEFETEVREEAKTLSDKMVDDWLEQAARRYSAHGTFPSQAAARRALEEGLFRPVGVPLVQAIFESLDGKIWIQREDQGDSGTRWDVFATEEESSSLVYGPKNVALLAASGRWAWGVTKNELDLPKVVRYVLRLSPLLSSRK